MEASDVETPLPGAESPEHVPLHGYHEHSPPPARLRATRACACAGVVIVAGLMVLGAQSTPKQQQDLLNAPPAGVTELVEQKPAIVVTGFQQVPWDKPYNGKWTYGGKSPSGRPWFKKLYYGHETRMFWEPNHGFWKVLRLSHPDDFDDDTGHCNVPSCRDDWGAGVSKKYADFPPTGAWSLWNHDKKKYVEGQLRIDPLIDVGGKWLFLECFVSDTFEYTRTTGFEESSGFDIGGEIDAAFEASGEAKLDAFILQMKEKFSASLELSINAEFRHDWQTTGSAKATSTYTSHAGQNCLWQFRWDASTHKWDNGFTHVKKSLLTSHIARTAGLWQPPKCLPGGAKDMPTYQQCAGGYDL